MKKLSLIGLTIGALGVVYGDIGTSPLYAVNQVFFGSHRVAITTENVLGTISLIFWTLTLILTVKYLLFVLRADFEGEGGVFALFGLLHRLIKGRQLIIISALLMVGAGLLFGDGMITPAISVLAAIEGLKILAPKLEYLVIPITILVLLGIFIFQRKGARRVGQIYGPIMLVWFTAIGLIGGLQVFHQPQILWAINPINAIRFISSIDLKLTMAVIGAVFLVLTGGEALYADLGHFGRKPIRLGWFLIAYPALLFNYAGQGAYLLSGKVISQGNIFYSLVPGQFLFLMIVLATIATIIASVAVIFGIYSLTAQAIALGLSPRFKIHHTSVEKEGQIYIPTINWLLFVGSVTLILGLKSTTNLASAYGLAVSGNMLIVSFCMIFIAIYHWRWNKLLAGLIFGGFFFFDAIFFISNSLKFKSGGYIPILIGLLLFLIMATWQWGRKLVRVAFDSYATMKNMEWLLNLKRRVEESGGILKDQRVRKLVEIDRAVIFMVSHSIRSLSDNVPITLRIYLKRTGAIPRDILFLTINQKKSPYIQGDRYQVFNLGMNVYSVDVQFGFMENPNVVAVLHKLREKKLIEEKFYRCSIETGEDDLIIDSDVPIWNRLRAVFFKILLKFSAPVYRYFGFSPEVEVGLSKTLIPLRLSREGIRVETPEVPFDKEKYPVDPDTLEPITVPFVKI